MIELQAMRTHVVSAIKFAAEYLPDRNEEEIKSYAEIYSEAAKVLVDGDAVIGAAFGKKHQVEDSEFVLQGIAVEEAYQRRGYGSMLLKEVEQAAIKYGCEKISLGSAENAEEFYVKNGYCPVCFKIYDKDKIMVYKIFDNIEDYMNFIRPSENGFVVFEKKFKSINVCGGENV